ncbi:tetratricopeptide repeat protein [Nibrella saemangeumensis]|uniref:Tetratricopeptide repeat protein n=1 Tax=Nibrella saemangeumensis TaxID=1084526 RepID=A0ABP8NT13_9BACT
MAKARPVKTASRKAGTNAPVTAAPLAGKVAPVPHRGPKLSPAGRYGLMATAALLVFIAYSFGFGNEFVDWDDMEYVVENLYVRQPSIAGLKALWQMPVALNYHPLTMMTLAANAALFGPKATSFIVTNTLLHVLNTGLVFALAYQLSRRNQWIGFFTALLWGLHPMHVESVVWVSERKDVLYTCFFLLACLSYLRYQTTGHKSWFLITFGLFVLACLSKAMAVVLPLVLLLLDYIQGRRPLSRASLTGKAPFFAAALFFGWLAVNVQGGGNFYGLLTMAGQQKEALGQEPFALRWLVYGSYGFLLYLIKLVIPYGLSALYPYPADVTKIPPAYWLGPVAFLLYLVVMAWAFRHNRRVVAFGMSFFLVTIVLVLQFMTVGTALMADRYSYLAYFGLLFMLVACFEQFSRSNPTNRMAWRVGAGLFAVVFFYLTIQQVAVWQNTETLWTNALRYYPEDDQIHERLATYYGKQNQLDQAELHFTAALKDGSNRFRIYEGLGNVYGLKGEPQKALAMYDQALRLDSTQGDTYYNRGLTRLKLNPAAAVPDFTKALQLMPYKDTLVLPQRAFAHLQAKQYQAALDDYTRTIDRQPANATAWHNRGVCRFNLGDRAGAVADIRQAIAMNPTYEEARQNLTALERLN